MALTVMTGVFSVGEAQLSISTNAIRSQQTDDAAEDAQ